MYVDCRTMTRQKVLQCSSREDTVAKLKSLSIRSPLCNVFGEGPTTLSDIPADLKDGKNGAVLGIDEAGRGPLLGPMVYCASFWSIENDEEMNKKGFDDSKALSMEARSRLFSRMKETMELGLCVRVIHASEISRNMFLANDLYNLNSMSHDAAISVIRAVLNAGVKLERVYIDTVGIADFYQNKLERIFEGSGIQFFVEKKADSKFAPCSAASIAAKVIRDELTANWIWSETNFEPAKNEDLLPIKYGSGYPSDPKCKTWMEKNLADPVFCFPDFLRFSWGPAKQSVRDNAVLVEWEADEEDETNGNDTHQQTRLSDFIDGNCRKRKKARFQVFEELGLSNVSSIEG